MHNAHGSTPIRLALIAFALATTIAFAGCVTTPDADRPPQEPTYVLVENQSFLDANVFVIRGGQRTRLGLVNGNSRQRFRIPDRLLFGVSSLQFLIDPVGSSRTPISNEIQVSAGEELRLVIPPM
jgi:hypothetical protein